MAQLAQRRAGRKAVDGGEAKPAYEQGRRKKNGKSEGNLIFEGVPPRMVIT